MLNLVTRTQQLIHLGMALALGATLLLSSAAGAAWEHPRGDSANTGFAKVDTLPAVNPMATPGVGPIAPGANPVIGPDGMVYVGNLKGNLMAFYPDGSEAWSRQLNPNHGGIVASPVIGADGSIYVVSTYDVLVRRDGQTEKHNESWLHKFTPGGGWLFASPFPEISVLGGIVHGVTTAFPNIWRWQDTEVIMAPVLFRGIGDDIRLVAFSTSGAVLANHRVTYRGYDVTGSSPITDAISGFFEVLGDCLGIGDSDLGCGFSASLPPDLEKVGWPMPGVAIWEYPQGSPWIWMADGISDTVAFKFDLNTGFSEIYRFSDAEERLSSPPVALDNVVAALGTEDGQLRFERTGVNMMGFGPITATPTRLFGGRLALIERGGHLSLAQYNTLVFDTELAGDSMVSAAASCTHLFASSTQEFVTFDLKTMTLQSAYAWTGGGISAPVIGPSGHVYVIASRNLYVFPPPTQSRFGRYRPVTTACDTPVATRDVIGR